MKHENLEEQGVEPLHDTEISQRLAELAEELRENRELYRTFGPYWWLVKRDLPGPSRRRGWFTRGYSDREVLARIDPGPSREARRRLMREALHYQAHEAADGAPYSDIHLLESGGEAKVYRLQDPDAGRQLDLFEELENRELRREEFLRRPATYLPTPWLRRGDEEVRRGATLRGVACYKRALLVAHDQESRLQAWLRIGTVCQERGEPGKAAVAYEQAYEPGKEGWILGLVGQALLEAGRPGEAALRLREALDATPGNPEYRAGLEAARRQLADQDSRFAISS
ncbi:MAG: hypothetical protein ACOC28_02685 [Alkalispirochaetaceae bacterium]